MNEYLTGFNAKHLLQLLIVATIINVISGCKKNRQTFDVSSSFSEGMFSYEVSIDSSFGNNARFVEGFTDSSRSYLLVQSQDSVLIFHKEIESTNWKKAILATGVTANLIGSKLQVTKELVSFSGVAENFGYYFFSRDNGTSWQTKRLKTSEFFPYSSHASLPTENGIWYLAYDVSSNSNSFQFVIQRATADGDSIFYLSSPVPKIPGTSLYASLNFVGSYLFICAEETILRESSEPVETTLYRFNPRNLKLDSITKWRNQRVLLSGQEKAKTLYVRHESNGNISYAELDVVKGTMSMSTQQSYKNGYLTIDSNFFYWDIDGRTLTQQISNEPVNVAYQNFDRDIKMYLFDKMNYSERKSTGFYGFSLTSKNAFVFDRTYGADHPGFAKTKIISFHHSSPIPKIDSCRLYQEAGNYNLEIFIHKVDGMSAGKFIRDTSFFRLEFANYSVSGFVKRLPVKTAFKPKTKDSLRWASTLDFNDPRIQENDTMQLYLHLLLRNHEVVESYDLGRFNYKINKLPGWISKYSDVIAPAIALILFYLIFSVLLLVAPLRILAIYNSRFFALIENIPAKYGGGLIRGFVSLFFERWFVTNTRTMDAWVVKNKDVIINAFEAEKTVFDRSFYVPLPITNQDQTGKLIVEYREPSAESLAVLFNKPTVAIEIIGDGGVGKTTLAVELARWLNTPLFSNSFFKRHYWLPVIIEEDVTSGDELFKVIKRKISSAVPDKILTDTFVKGLLESQRILVIVDALSERSPDMQRAVKTLFGNRFNINALIITARYLIDLETSEGQFLYPSHLNNSQLAYFIDQILDRRKIDLFKTRAERSALLDKIIELGQFKEVEIPISPILVDLFMINIIKKGLNNSISSRELLMDIPISVSAVYLQYIKNTNKNTNDSISEAVYEDGVKYIAMRILGDNFIPNDIMKSDLIKELKIKFSVDGDKFVEKSENNGIIKVENFNDAIPMVRFLLDPVSEFLAAIYYAELYRGDIMQWKSLYAKLLAINKDDKKDFPHNFVSAMLQVHEELKKPYQLPEPDAIEEYKALEAIYTDAVQQLGSAVKSFVAEVVKGFSSGSNN